MATLEERQKTLKRFAKLRRLTGTRPPSKPTTAAFDAAFANLASQLKGKVRSSEIQIRVLSSKGFSDWAISIMEGWASARRGAAAAATLDLCIILGEDDAWSIVQGKSSPGEIYRLGRIRIIGDCTLVKSLYKKIALKGDTDII